MAVPLSIKTASRWLFSFYRAARKIRNCFFFLHKTPSRSATLQLPSLSSSAAADDAKRHLGGRKGYSLLLEFPSALLRSNSLFPFFMAVAFESGGPLRALLLLLAYPVILLLGPTGEPAVRVMTFVTFCGLRCGVMDVVGRAVLPKIYMEEIDRRSFEVAAAAGKRVVVSSLPVVMVKRFVEDCFGPSEVVGPELEVTGGRYYTGRLRAGGTAAERAASARSRLAEETPDPGLLNQCGVNDQLLVSYSKEVYAETTSSTAAENSSAAESSSAAEAASVDRNYTSSTNFPRKMYPKPLIFHDGRLAFLPTPGATLALLLWLPFAALLSVLRILVGVLLPYHVSPTVGAALGVRLRVRLSSHTQASSRRAGPGVLFVCTHRTLLDPIFLSHALCRPIPVVTYSLSRFSESISPIPTIRLTRDRRRDAEAMLRLLEAGDLAVCPEGTTCREPYLLRFSPLFAELAVDIEPVALNAESSMFYATTATGLKSLDPIFFFMNPRPAYRVSFLGRVPKEMTIAGGWTAAEVANRIQRELAEELGFQCTSLTRRDKYILLARNDGVVAPPPPAAEKY